MREVIDYWRTFFWEVLHCEGLFFNDFVFQLVSQVFSFLQPFPLLCRQLLQRKTAPGTDVSNEEQLQNKC